MAAELSVVLLFGVVAFPHAVSISTVSYQKITRTNAHAATALVTSSSIGHTIDGHSFVFVVVGLPGAAMIAMKIVQRRDRVLLRRNQYSEVDATATRIHV